MKRSFTLVLIIVLIPLELTVAQTGTFKDQIKTQLGDKDKNTVEKVEKLYESTRSEFRAADELEAVNKKKALKQKISASGDLGKANKMLYNVYENDLEHFFNQIDAVTAKKANQKMDMAKELMKEAKKKREASLRLNVLENAYELLDKANKEEEQALNYLVETYKMFISEQSVGDKEDISEENNQNNTENDPGNNEEIETDKGTDDNNTDNKELTDTEVNNAEVVSDNVEPIHIVGTQGVMFLVQVAASKSPLSEANLKKNYKYPIHSERFDEWYKYFINKKFDSFEEADEYKTQSGIRGCFVVAFKNGEKVSLEEANKKDEIVKQEELKYEPVGKREVLANIEKNPQVIYRLEIGISTSRLSAAEVRQFKNGGKAVIPVDRGGWFSYTIGDFNTEAEALNFKRIKGLADATLLKMKDEKIIE